VPEDPPPPLPDFLAAELPFARRQVRLTRGPDAGRTIHAIDHGARDGRPVLLIHGNPTWCYLWRKVIAGLDPGRFRCVAPDLLGFGLSSKLLRARDHTLDRHLDALTQAVEALDLGPGTILVGQDWGGPMVVGVGARLLRERVAGIVLGNTSVLTPSLPRGTWFHRFSRMPLVSDLAFRVAGFPLPVLHTAQGDKGSIAGDVLRAYRWPLDSPLTRAGMLGLARMVPAGVDHPSLPALRELERWVTAFEGPMALVWGTRDPILGRALKKHERAFPQAPVTRTDAGHFLQEEVPERLVDAILDVVARAEAGS
jgi:haloalkane dehalogenase